MRTKIRKSISLLLAATLMFMTMTDGTAAQAAKKSQKANVKVSSVKITNVKKKLRLQKGKRFKLKTSVKVKPNKSKYKKLKFTSSNRKVVLVNSRGLLKGMRVGTAKITAASKSNAKKKATISVSVTKDVLVSGIRLNKTKITADEFNEEEIQLEVKKILPANAKNKKVEWSTSDDDVADVDDDGVVTTGDVGTAVITATAADKGGATATCKVIVKENTEVPDDDDISDGDANNGNGNPAVVPTSPAGVVTPAPVPGDTTSPSPDASAGVATPAPVPDGKKTPSPSALPSRTPTTDNQIFGVSDPYRITISEENEAYATSVSKRLANGMSEEDAASRNKDPEFHADGSVTFTSTNQYNSGMCFYIDPDVKVSVEDDGTANYQAKKVDLTRYSKVRITVKYAYMETSLKILTNGSNWWSKGEKWEDTDASTKSNRVIEYDLDEGQGLTWEQLKEAETIGLAWHNKKDEMAMIVSIELVGKRDAVTPTEKPEASEEPTALPSKVPMESTAPDEETASPSVSAEPSVKNEFGVSDPYKITISEKNTAYATSVSKRLANGMSEEEAECYSKDTVFNEDGSVAFTSTDQYNSGMCFYIDPNITISTGEDGSTIYTAKKADLTNYSKIRFTVRGAYCETSLKILTDGNNWWSKVGEQWEGMDNIENGERVVEYDLNVNSWDEWSQLKKVEAIGLGWINAVDETATIVSIELVGKHDVTPPPKNQKDVEALEKLIAEQRALGADVSEDIDEREEYRWNEEGCLTFINWGYIIDETNWEPCSRNLSGSISFSPFTELEQLNCNGNQLSSLDVSGNGKLTALECSENQLSDLDVSGNMNLTFLNCSENQLSSLDVSGNEKLTSLNCSGNQLSDLDVSGNVKLTTLGCSGNQLSDLDVSGNVKLTTLGCRGNQLSSLDVSGNVKLTTLNCRGNQLSSLELGNNTELQDLDCADNQLSSLEVSNNKYLWKLWCWDNQLSSLDVSSNVNLEFLGCDYNQLSSLDVSNNTMLRQLSCTNNQLSSLDLTNNTRLTTLDCDDTVTVTGYNK